MPNPILHNLDTRPTASDAYLWCDYIELRCLAHADHRFSRGNLLEALEEAVDLAPDEPAAEDDAEDTEAELGEAITPDPDDDSDADGLTPVATPSVPRSDRNESKTADLFHNLAYRVQIFGDAYPFVLDESEQELSLREINTASRKLYLQLLLSASLRLVPKRRRHELTEPFERLSARIFTCLMPSGWEVHQFGAKSATRYTGHLFDRLKKLADDLRGKLLVERRHFSTTNAGDGGLDIVAWHPMGGDVRIGIPIALAQCGCTAEEWSLKSMEASPTKLGGNLHTLHPWATYYFMPQDLVDGRGPAQDWQRRPDLTPCVVVDRMRLIRLANQYGVENDCANATNCVDEAMNLATV